MTSKTFTSGTVLDSAWLNDVNGATYNSSGVYTPAGTGVVATTVQTKLRESLSVKDFGATGNGTTDDTTAIQTAITYVINQGSTGIKCLVFPPGNYSVSQISFYSTSSTVSGCTFIFEGAQIVGKATGSYSAVVEVMCGISTFINMSVNANFNSGYESAVHWYTNNVSQSYPGFMKFQGLTITQAVRGLVVGMLPSQSSTYYAGNATVAKPLAIDAPVSESYIDGLRTTYCVEGFRMEQPNGKLTLTNSHISGDDTSQTGFASSTNPLVLINGELSMIGGTLELISETAGFCGSIGGYTFGSGGSPTGANLNLSGVIIESVAPMYIKGNTVVRINQDLNWGMNGNKEFFWVDQNSIGELIVSDSFLLRGAGTSYSSSVVKGVSNTAGSFAPAYNFNSSFTNVRFSNATWQQGATYQPLTNGLVGKYLNCLYSVYNSSVVRTVASWFDTVKNALVGVVDLSAGVITAYAANGTASSGGWSFSTVSGGSWGRYSTGLPTILTSPVSQALRITCGAGGETNAGSPKFPVEAGTMKVLTGFIKTGTTGGQIFLALNFYKWDNSASSTATTYLFLGAESQFGATWRPFEMWAVVPNDASQAALVLDVQNGTDLQLFGLKLS